MRFEAVQIKEIGVVKEVKNLIARVSGLPSCIYGQLVNFQEGSKGMVIGFTRDEIQVLILSDETKIKAGDGVEASGGAFKLPVGNAFLGRIVTALAEPFDGLGPIQEDDFYPIFRKPAGVMQRTPLANALQTGTKIIDATLPLGKGQRQLIIGDRMTGKSIVALDAILNQKGKDVMCVYCCLGRTSGSLLKIVELFKERNAMEYTIVVAAPSSSPAGEQYLAPYTACTLAEHFFYQGKDVLVVFDDLSKHSWVYRQISLLLERSPGREAYPGDMFYVHSQLMERAGRLNKENGGGTMTFLPIVETQQGDVTGLVPNNLIAMTDGQVYFSTTLYNEGVRPAIDLGLSVSRIGSRVQCASLRQLSGKLRLEYLQYRELAGLMLLKAELSDESRLRIKRGQTLTNFFLQDKYWPIQLAEQILCLYAYQSGIFDRLSEGGIKKFMHSFYSYISRTHPGLPDKIIASGKGITDELKARLDETIEAYIKLEKIV